MIMWLEVTSPGGFEILYEAARKALEQVPAMLQLLSTAPVYVIQVVLLVILFVGLDPLVNLIDKIATFFKWLNDRL